MARHVLLVHGFSTSAQRTWAEPGWIDLLTEAGRVVHAPDLLGHGEAPKPHDPAAYAEVEQRVADALPDEPVDAIGYSAGARVVLALALADPSRYDRLVLGGVGQGLLRPRGSSNLVDAIESDTEPDDVVAAHFRAMAHSEGNDPVALAAFLRRDQPRLDLEAMAALTVPTLVVIGDQDFAGPGRPLADALGEGQCRTLRGVDHFGLPKSFDFLDQALRFIGADPLG